MSNSQFGSGIDPKDGTRREHLLERLTVGGRDAKNNLEEFLSTLDLLPYAEIEPAKLITWPAHPTAIAKIRAGSWQTSALITTSDGRLSSRSASNFDIHFEVQVLQQQRNMSLSLHYETNPYLSQKKLYKRLEAAALESHLRRRNEFIAEFKRRCDVRGFEVRSNVVQIGKAVYDFTDRDPAEVARWMEKMIDDISCIVNETLYRLDERACFIAQADSEEPAPLPVMDDSDAGPQLSRGFHGGELSRDGLIGAAV